MWTYKPGKVLVKSVIMGKNEFVLSDKHNKSNLKIHVLLNKFSVQKTKKLQTFLNEKII